MLTLEIPMRGVSEYFKAGAVPGKIFEWLENEYNFFEKVEIKMFFYASTIYIVPVHAIPDLATDLL